MESIPAYMRARNRFMNRLLNPRALSVGVLVLVMFFLNVGASYCQPNWQLLFTQPNGDGFSAAFFFNESVGFIGGELTDGVYKTTNGGQTWINTLLPNYPNGPQPNGFITQILMTDQLNGWLTCEPKADTSNPNEPSVYQTSNGGLSWEPTGLTGGASDIYITPSAIIIISRNLLGSGYISTDGGNTWRPSLDTTNGIDFVDDLHGVATGFQEQVWYNTVDGGLNWVTLSPADTIETWGIYGVKGFSWFFTAGEGDGRNGHPFPFSSVRHSRDFGATWVIGTELPFHTTGDMEGFGFTLYVQPYNGDKIPGSGLYGSKDSGQTWVSIGGPVNTKDTRFAVTGCRGEVIYAFDTKGNVWKTSDGGDGSLPQFSLPPSPLNIDWIDVCNPQYRDSRNGSWLRYGAHYERQRTSNPNARDSRS